MQARAREPRSDVAELDGHAQEFLARGTSVLGIEEGFAGAVRKPERREALAAIVEDYRLQIAVAQPLAFPVNVVVDRREVVALAQVMDEVDVVAQCIGELSNHCVTHTGFLASREQRAIDHAVDHVRAALNRAIEQRFVQAGSVEGDGDAGMVVAIEAHCVQRAVFIALERELVTRMNVAQRRGIGLVSEQA